MVECWSSKPKGVGSNPTAPVLLSHLPRVEGVFDNV